MSNNLYSKKAIIKERISELKTTKFRFEINRIQLPNGHEGEYGQIIFPNAAPGCLMYPYSPSCPLGSSILFISKLNFFDFNSDIFSLKMDLFIRFLLSIILK